MAYKVKQGRTCSQKMVVTLNKGRTCFNHVVTNTNNQTEDFFDFTLPSIVSLSLMKNTQNVVCSMETFTKMENYDKGMGVILH